MKRKKYSYAFFHRGIISSTLFKGKKGVLFFSFLILSFFTNKFYAQGIANDSLITITGNAIIYQYKEFDEGYYKKVNVSLNDSSAESVQKNNEAIHKDVKEKKLIGNKKNNKYVGETKKSDVHFSKDFPTNKFLSSTFSKLTFCLTGQFQSVGNTSNFQCYITAFFSKNTKFSKPNSDIRTRVFFIFYSRPPPIC